MRTPDETGQVNITVHSGVKRLRGGSDPAASAGDGSRAYTRMGNEQFQIGNYSGAASSLEQALRAGGDAVSVNQRLGQSYQSLGRKSDAVAAYQRCIEACSSAIGRGRGDSTRLKAVKDACESAVSQLQGN